jgi:flavin-dependent dehydrogenase
LVDVSGPSGFDALVVGAGYAGLACAAMMPGRRVLVLERHDSVVTKRRGGFGFLLPVGDAAEVRGQDLFLKAVNLLVEGGVRGRLNHVELRGRRERVDLHLHRPLMVLDEGRIKGAMLRKVREQGVEVRLRMPVRDFQVEDREILVRAEEDFRARLLVGADGSHSLVARSLGGHREQAALLFQRELEVQRQDFPEETLRLEIDERQRLFIAFPVGDRVVACGCQFVAPRGVPDDLDGFLRDRLDRLPAGRALAGREAVVRLSGRAPLSFQGHVMLAGDAVAALGFATIGGAISMGALAGQAATRVLSGSRYALPDYHRRWRQQTSQRLIERAPWVFPLLARLRADRIDGLLRALRGPHRKSSVDAGDLWWRLPSMVWNLVV